MKTSVWEVTLYSVTTSDGCLTIPEIGKKVFDTLVGPHFLQWMLNEKLTHWTVYQYKTLASTIGFRESDITIKVIPYYPTWSNLDAYISAMHGWFQGEFDPTRFDEDALKELKKEHGSGPVIQSEPINIVYATLTKTCSLDQL